MTLFGSSTEGEGRLVPVAAERVRLVDGVDAWAPAEGFIVNAGVRLNFGGD